jgi:D-alanine transaminase
METAFLNGNFLPKNEIKISPDDRGFLFADGIYEVVRWYEGFFFDMASHMMRLKRSMREIRISWADADTFPLVAQKLITLNNLQNRPALVYLQVTRGAAKRTHAFPAPPVEPTVYAFAMSFRPDSETMASGIGVILRKDIRWSRCDIKSVSLLPNVLSFQEARELGNYECIFVRDGLITEGAHSNVFFVIKGVLYTHPESENVLPGVTRKNVLRIARETGIRVMETAVPERRISELNEAFITNTSSEVAPVVSINNKSVGEGIPGPVTKLLQEKFVAGIRALKG